MRNGGRNTMTLHERIASLRRAAGLSQEALAAEVNVTRQAIGKWETGASLPGVENLQALASALHVSCDELLTGEKPEAKNGAPEGDGITVAGVAALLNAENAAREQGTQRQRRALLALAAAVVCVCAALIVCAVLYHSRMQTMSEQLNGILNRVSGIETGIDIRIGNIQNAIQSSLNEQASILASYDWQYGTPKGTESVPLSLTATPKTFREGQTAVFTAAPGSGAPLTFPAQEQDGVFYADASIPLEERFDSFALSVSFTQDGETQTEFLWQETDFVTSRQTTAALMQKDFETTRRGDVLTLGGTVSLEVSSGWAGYAPIPESAVIELIVDGETVDRQELALRKDFAPPDWVDTGDQAYSLVGPVTYYLRFEKVEYPLPTQGAEVVATITDSSGAVTTVRDTLYSPDME